MKGLILVFLMTTVSLYSYSQTDTTTTQFIELLAKSQGDKNLSGVFIYKGYNVRITESKDYKTAIGKFIEVIWMYKDNNDQTAIYKAVYHNTMGYMTRGIFGTYKQAFKDYKISKNKYCQETFCIELKDDIKLPYILTIRLNKPILREIK